VARSRRLLLPLTLGLLGASLLFLVLNARGASEDGGGDAGGQPGAAPASETADDSMPCTSPGQPTNFEAFSAGGSPLGLPLTATLRRCDIGTEEGEPGANYVSYIYGECEYRNPENGDGGCAPPLEVQTWPACRRSLANYTYEGKPLPHEPLPDERRAEVAGFEEGGRLEVYSGSSTVVVFANDPEVAQKVLSLLRPQAPDSPPATRASELETEIPQELVAPDPGATEGKLACDA
jgi:hypothetical protein